MAYTFEILGVSPILQFFNHQQETFNQSVDTGVEYVGCYKCSLDTVISSIETVSPKRGWNLDEAVDTVIQFWMHYPDQVDYWKQRLRDAGEHSLLVSRMADVRSLRVEFDRLLEQY